MRGAILLAAILACAHVALAAPKFRPQRLAVARDVNDPVLLLCSCTAINCTACNVCRCFLADGGVKEIAP